MEKFKKFLKKVFYPHIALLLILLPISIAFLVYALVYLGSESPFSYVAYLLSFYCLVVVCLQTPNIIKFFKSFKDKNKLIKRLIEDLHYRLKFMLFVSMIVNVAFAIYQLGLGFYHKSFWFYSLAIYYVLLAFMRFYLSKHVTTYEPNKEYALQLKKSRFCGYLLMTMNLALAVIIFFMVYFNRTSIHHEITTIVIATYTFGSLTIAITSLIRYKQFDSPVYNTIKAISLIAASVSMLTLTSTMLTTFGNTDELFRQLILSFVGGAVIILVMIIAIKTIINSYKLSKKEVDE